MTSPSPPPFPPERDSELTRLDPQDLSVLLAEHRLWLQTAGREGKRAELRRCDLSGLNLEAADLRHADLRDSRLEGTRLINSRLNFADLSGTTHLLPHQLAGADVSGIKLPDRIDLYDRLKHIEEVTVSGRSVFFLLLLAVAYTWLTIGTTSDVDLLTNASTSPLPIIFTEIPIRGFYWAAPLILLGCYVYFHLHLLHLWQDLAALPAFFPDGRALDDKAHPWLLIGLINAHCQRLRDTRPALAGLQNALSIILAWYVIPLTIAAVWLRYLPRHDWYGTGFHIVIMLIAAVTGSVFYRLTIITLEGKKHSGLALRGVKPATRRGIITAEAIIAIAVFVLLPVLSYGAMTPGERGAGADPRHWVPVLMKALGYSPFANFSDKDISTRPVDWMENTSPVDMVKGADLKNADLHHAEAAGAFLVKADLRGADLRNIDLELANLRQANLEETDLRDANLLQADLRGSDLDGADLRGAVLLRARLENARLNRTDLREAFLNQAMLQNADLSMADLRNAQLNQADLRGANLELSIMGGANLQGTDLREVLGLECAQIEATLTDSDTRLPANLDCSFVGRKPEAFRRMPREQSE